MINITRKDYEFLFKLNSLNLALGTSAHSSVAIPYRDEEGIIKQSKELNQYSHVYYDVEGDGSKIMKKRISDHEDDIRQHYKLHRAFNLTFSAIEDAAKKQNRINIGKSTAYLCREAWDYVRLVKDHEHKAGEESFLKFPTCIKGPYFHIPNLGVMDPEYKGLILELEFNSRQNEEYACRDLLRLEDLITDFVAQKEEFNLTSAYTPELRDDGINSFSKKLNTVKLLLEKAGLRLEQE